MSKEKCRKCGWGLYRIILNITDCEDSYLNYLGIEYPVDGRYYVKCSICGLVYRKPRLNGREKKLLYKKFRDVRLRGESNQSYFKRISELDSDQSENYEKYRFLEKYINKKGRLLDVGAGLGVFLYGFKKYFPKWNAIGVEPTTGAGEIAIIHDIKIHEQYLDMNLFPNRHFDLITSIHVLEHTENPLGYIKKLTLYMEEDSLLYIETPSIQDVGHLPKCHDRFMCQHDFIFSENVLCDLLKNTGMEIIYSEIFLSIRKRYNLRVLCKKAT